MRRLALLAAPVLMLLTGCATHVPPPTVEATFEMLPPRDEWKVQNRSQTERPFREVWYGLLAGLVKGPFILENASIDSGVIVASFAFASGEDYVDCGRSRRTYVRDGAEAEFDYAISSDSAYESGYNYDGCTTIRQIARDTTLEGRVDIRVIREGEGTVVAIDAEYKLTAAASGSYEILCPDRTLSGLVDTHTRSVELSTTESTEADWGVPGRPLPALCRCTGRLERDILAFVE